MCAFCGELRYHGSVSASPSEARHGTKRMRRTTATLVVAWAWAASAVMVGAYDGKGETRLASLTPPVSPTFLKGEWIDWRGRLDHENTIDTFARMNRLDPKFVQALVAVESNYNPRAVSRKGAMGLMQLMPATAKHYGVEDPFHPTQNVEAGTRHLRVLLDRYQGNLELALAAYNAGETAVARYGGIPPFPETRQYVRKILGLYYGTLTPPSDRWYRYEDETGRMRVSNAVPAGARNISPVLLGRGANF